MLRSFQRSINIGAAPKFDPVSFRNRIFLLNSNYSVASNASDAEAFDAFRDMCISAGEIYRDDLTQGVLPIHLELQQALDTLEESKAAIAKALQDHQQMLERMHAEAAAAQQASEEQHQRIINAICLAAEEHIQVMMSCCA